jgi:hypothetical protein
MTKPWVKVLEKVQLFERAHSPNESNTESSGFKINFTECTNIHKIRLSDFSKVAEFSGNTSRVNALTYDPEDFIFSAAENGLVHKIRVSDMTSVASRNVGGATRTIVFAGNSVVIGISNVIEKIDRNSLARLARNTSEHNDVITSLVFDRGFVYTACVDTVIRKWEIVQFVPVSTYRAFSNPVRSLALGGDRFLYAGSDGNVVHQIEPLTFGQVHIYSGHNNPVLATSWGIDLFTGTQTRIDKVNTGTMSQTGGSYTDASSTCLVLNIRTTVNTFYKFIAF